MSKSKGNYPDPMEIVKKYGADACRLYLCNSPLMRAEPLKFREEGVKSVIRDVFLPWYNAYRFLIQNINRWEKATQKNFVFDPNFKKSTQSMNIMDKWILAANQILIKNVRTEMDGYRLYTVVAQLLDFLSQLTNWYVRLNRLRLKGEQGADQQNASLNTLFEVTFNTTIMMACITPFMSEFIYQNMRNGISPEDKHLYADSIHFLSIPDYEEELIDERVVKRVERMQTSIVQGRYIRDLKAIGLRKPLQKVTIVNANPEVQEDLKELQTYIKEELNCIEFEIEPNEEEYVEY